MCWKFNQGGLLLPRGLSNPTRKYRGRFPDSFGTPGWGFSARPPQIRDRLGIPVAQWKDGPHLDAARKVQNVRAPWRDLGGPSRSLAICATILLVASAMAGFEAVVLMILGPARDVVVKPFVILGYLEGCAIFFSLIGIVVSIICLVLYAPYQLIREKAFMLRASRAPQKSDQFTYFETVPRVHLHNPDDDGAPD